MARQRLDRRRVKRHLSYTVDEAARTIGASKGTVRRWLSSGLPAIRDRKPLLILGEDLSAHMAGESKSKQHCPPGTCYCVKCRDVRRPAGDMVEFVPIDARSGNLRAICPECGNWMHRRTSNIQLEALRVVFDVSIVERHRRLNDSEHASVDDDLGKD